MTQIEIAECAESKRQTRHVCEYWPVCLSCRVCLMCCVCEEDENNDTA